MKVQPSDAGRFFGSGHLDFGLDVAMENTLAECWIVHLTLSGVVPTGHIARLTLQPSMTSITGFECLWSARFSLILQFYYCSSSFNRTGGQNVTEVVAGFNNHLCHNLLWQVYGVKNVDFITGGAADFTYPLCSPIDFKVNAGTIVLARID